MLTAYVETLLARFPCLRVAYLEVVKDRRAGPNGAEEEAEVTTRYSSVLVRKSGGAVEELSRVALFDERHPVAWLLSHSRPRPHVRGASTPAIVAPTAAPLPH